MGCGVIWDMEYGAIEGNMGYGIWNMGPYRAIWGCGLWSHMGYGVWNMGPNRAIWGMGYGAIWAMGYGIWDMWPYRAIWG